MHRQSYRNLFAGVLMVVCGSAMAEGFGGKFSLGAIATSGNSETSTVNFGISLKLDQAAWHHGVKGTAVHARSETTDDATGQSRTQTTSERYTASLRSARDFSETDYLYAQVDFDKDLFGGVRERTAETVGYGRRLLHSEAHKLDLELGAGARQLRPQGEGAERVSDAVGRAALRYDWTITPTSRFSQSVSVESGDENTYTESVSELKLAVIGSVFVNLGFSAQNNSEVPAGTQRTDTTSSVSLSYEF